MSDERIQTTANRFAAMGFIIWFALTAISLNYRLLILKQHPRDFWDFIAIFFIVTFFVSIAYATKGIFDHNSTRRWLTICIFVLIGIFTSQLITGRIHSVVDVGVTLIGSLSGMGLVIGIVYFLNRRWKRKAGIEDEK